MLRKVATVLGMALCLTAATAAIAGAQDDFKRFAVGIRGVFVYPDEKFDHRLEPLNPTVDADVTPGIDLEYFFTRNISTELFAAVTHHDIKAAGEIIGSTWLLPPTLTVKFHPLAGKAVSPYVGGGVNVTMPFRSRVDATVGGASLGNTSDFSINNHIGWVAQGGADFNINQNLFFNLDYKYVSLDTHFHLNGEKYKLDLNPHLFGVGLGYRF